MRTIALLPLALAACSSPSTSHDCAGDCSMPAPTKLSYSVAHVTGSFGGSDTNTMSAAMDMLEDATCTFDSAGTSPDQALGVFSPPQASPAIGGVQGKVSCPVVDGFSVPGTPCHTSDVVTLDGAPFSWTIGATAWDDDSTVSISALGPPSGLPYCNTAEVVTDPAQPWGITGTTTVGAFRAAAPFDVHLTGSSQVTSDTHVSDVHWDLTITFQPLGQ